MAEGPAFDGKGLERIIVNGEAPSAVFAAVNTDLTTAAEPILEDLKALEG